MLTSGQNNNQSGDDRIIGLQSSGTYTLKTIDLKNSSFNHLHNFAQKMKQISNGELEATTTQLFDSTTNNVNNASYIRNKDYKAVTILRDEFYVCHDNEEQRLFRLCKMVFKDRCLEPLDRGVWCEKLQFQYYYNNEEKRCKGDIYTGCGESANKFRTMVECEQSCLFRAMKPSALEPVAPLNVQRSDIELVLFGNDLYAIGGSDGTCGCVVEKYSPRNDTWTQVQHMRQGRTNFATAILNNKIFVCGGKWHSMQLKECEMYNPLTDNWTNISPMKQHRQCLTMAELNGFIYATGNCGNNSKSTEIYDPEKNEWSVIEDFKLVDV